MSLKAFHIVFVAVSVLLAFGFSFWLFRSYQTGGGSSDLVWAIVSFISGIGLLIYGRFVLRKLKNISYL